MSTAPARPWDTPAVLALVSFIVGPLVLPFLAPGLGVTFLRASSCWTPRARRIGVVAGLLPSTALIVLLLLAVTDAERPGTFLDELALVLAVHVAPISAGLALLGRWARLGVPDVA